jgi:magnesium transporter
MSSNEPDPRPWDSLLEIAQKGDAHELVQFVQSLPPSEAVRAISRLDSQSQSKVLTTIGPQKAAQLIEDCPLPQAAELMEQLQPHEAARILSEMASDEKADLITSLSAEEAEAILGEMGAEEAAEARTLARYAPDEAGGLMVTEFLSFPESFTAGEVLDDLRQNAERYANFDVQYVYCCSEFGDLVGVLRLRDLLLTPRDRRIADFMIRKPLAVNVHTTLDELAELFEKHAFFGVPVLDAGSRLTGIVKRRDIELAISNRLGSDYLKSQGIVGGEELRSMPLWPRVTRRLSWLTGNIVLNIAAAAVVAFYQDTLAQVIALAVFLPIISDMSGNAGIQAIAVSLREMTLGVLKPSEVFWVFMKELAVGVINGIVLGVLVAIGAFLWKGNPYLGLVVGSALTLNTVLAAVVGGTLPMIFKRMKIDPALASGPILTTITDMCGFFFVLSFASLLLPKLVEHG